VSDAAHDSLVTVLVAGAANLGIAVAKLVAGVLSGSSAMLSEAAHSFADTVNEVLLVVASRRASAPASARHPFGHGQESFFWAFLAALATFVLGAGFSITHGIHTISHGSVEGHYFLAYAVLTVSAVLELVSLRRSLQQVRATAGRWSVSPRALVQSTPDTALKAVVLEDIAALVGLALAAAGLGLEWATGSAVWDGLASVAIGVLLVVVAGTLALDNVSLLTGESAPPRVERAIIDLLAAQAGIDRIVTLRTMMLGPHDVLVAAVVDFDDRLSAAEVEAVADAAQAAVTARFAGVRHVYLDPTAVAEG